MLPQDTIETRLGLSPEDGRHGIVGRYHVAMASLADPRAIEELVRRLGQLHDRRPRAWGRMTAHEMLCHLADSFRACLGERPISSVDTWFQRSVTKYIALHTS